MVTPKFLENEDGARAVHAVYTFPARTLANGMIAAQALQVTLQGNVAKFFDQAVFGAVHMEMVSAPHLVRAPQQPQPLHRRAPSSSSS